MPKHFDSPEAAVLYLSDEVTRLSGEVLAANVLAALALRLLGVDANAGEEARRLLARVKLEGGDDDENARLLAAAQSRLETLLSTVQSR